MICHKLYIISAYTKTQHPLSVRTPSHVTTSIFPIWRHYVKKIASLTVYNVLLARDYLIPGLSACIGYKPLHVGYLLTNLGCRTCLE